MSDSPRLILAKGEEYVEPTEKGHGGNSPTFPRTFDEARDRLYQNVSQTLEKLAALPDTDRVKNESTVCVRMNPSFTAKSYDPIILSAGNSPFREVGSRVFRQKIAGTPESAKTKKAIDDGHEFINSRLVFLQGEEEGFQKLLSRLERSTGAHTKKFKETIQAIEQINLLTPEEKLAGFETDTEWSEGRVELVLHPSHYGDDAQRHFLSELFSDFNESFERLRMKSYDDGPTFVSCRLKRDLLNHLANTNPLRSARPMEIGNLPTIREASGFTMPPPSSASAKSTIKVGLFDGGIDETHPHLIGHATEDQALSIQTPKDSSCISHGSGVAGALLYGPLHLFSPDEELPAPSVAVESFRVLPLSDPNDQDLYECIDIIEKVVPLRPEIKFFNVSLGPRGPILDDSISRFTFALDRLAHQYEVGFCVAVGNDGKHGSDYGRIQSPSDMVNGLGIGAHSFKNGEIIPTTYSCVGPGREAAKAKPDVVAFGGCDQTPFQLLSLDHGEKAMSLGTSFSTPLISSLGAQLTGAITEGNPLLSRTLLVHTADHQKTSYDTQVGHGIAATQLDQIVSCTQDEVTIIYQGKIKTKNAVKLPFRLPVEVLTSGKVEMTWTIGISPKTKGNHPFDYTDVCIEDTFHPHSQKFNFNPPKGTPSSQKKKLNLIDDKELISKLESKGWKRSAQPLPDSNGNRYNDESALRSNFKWEPIVRRSLRKMASSVHEPFVVLKATPRGDQDEIVSYCAVVTLKPTQDIDLYSRVLQHSQALQPVKLRAETRISLNI